jgi:hypothetical protein
MINGMLATLCVKGPVATADARGRRWFAWTAVVAVRAG